MKTLDDTRILGLALALVLTLLVCSACSKQKAETPKSDSVVMQGTWSGAETGAKTPAECSLAITGSVVEFHGANPQEWYKATFTLQEDTNPKQLIATVTDCPFPKYVGKVSRGIYKIEGDTMTLAANEPGRPDVPSAFDAANSRQFVLKRK